MTIITKVVRYEEREVTPSTEARDAVLARFRALGYAEFYRDRAGRVTVALDRESYERGHYLILEE